MYTKILIVCPHILIYSFIVLMMPSNSSLYSMHSRLHTNKYTSFLQSNHFLSDNMLSSRPRFPSSGSRFSAAHSKWPIYSTNQKHFCSSHRLCVTIKGAIALLPKNISESMIFQLFYSTAEHLNWLRIHLREKKRQKIGNSSLNNLFLATQR